MSYKSLFSNFISHSENKLVIKMAPFDLSFIGSIFSLIFIDILFGIFLPLYLIISLGDELFMRTKALNSSKLNCNRINNQVSCSLTGAYLLGNEEKVINSKHGKLLKATKRSFRAFDRYFYRNNLLVLVTEKEELYMYTMSDILDKQISQLNNFLQNQEELKITIEANDLFVFNLFALSSSSFLHPDISKLISILLYASIACMFIYKLVNAKIYIFDKGIEKLIVLKCLSNTILREINLQRIKNVYVKRIKKTYNDEGREITVFRYELSICDDADSKLLESVYLLLMTIILLNILPTQYAVFWRLSHIKL